MRVKEGATAPEGKMMVRRAMLVSVVLAAAAMLSSACVWPGVITDPLYEGQFEWKVLDGEVVVDQGGGPASMRPGGQPPQRVDGRNLTTYVVNPKPGFVGDAGPWVLSFDWWRPKVSSCSVLGCGYVDNRTTAGVDAAEVQTAATTYQMDGGYIDRLEAPGHPQGELYAEPNCPGGDTSGGLIKFTDLTFVDDPGLTLQMSFRHCSNPLVPLTE